MSMSLLMLAHSVTGIAVVISGAVALLSAKGSRVHKLSGNFYVALMLLMGLIVLSGAWALPGTISSLGILFVFLMSYLVLTSWWTIKNSGSFVGFWDYLAPLTAMCIFFASVMLGLDALRSPIKGVNTPPVGAYFFFAILALFAMLLDANHLRVGGVSGKHRKLRHLWRMICALFFATSTLFTGPGSVIFPEAVRDSIVFSIPQSLVIGAAIFWAYKVFFSDRRSKFWGKTKNHL